MLARILVVTLLQSSAFVDSAEDQSRTAVDAKAEQWSVIEQRRIE